jgi:hypothetical protein
MGSLGDGGVIEGKKADSLAFEISKLKLII